VDAGAGGAVAGGAGSCAPAARAIDSAAPAIVFTMRFEFVIIGAVPPKKELLL
jgi:hypothetical protein